MLADKKFLVKYSRDEWNEKNEEEFAGIQEERAKGNAAKVNHWGVQMKKEREREAAREQKQKQRAQKKELEISSGIWSSDGAIKKV
jgi:hypothetical protein